MVKVPKDLSGASLLGVHNWVKSNIALSNPGASPDYTITDAKGDRLTLSDVARSAGQDIDIEVTTLSGVRSNPAMNLTMVPSTHIPYSDMVRTGNNLSDLLPGEIDSAMATRIVAEQGLHRGLHTLNRMTLTSYNKQISTPTTAALLQMGELIKKNPSDRTPFTQRTPLQYGSEKALQQWLLETANIDNATEEEISVENTNVENAKIHAKYGLNTQDIKKFSQDVLSDYLFAASANRGLIRYLIKGSSTLRTDRQTIQKLVSMFPQQPADFYEGRQRVFAAHPAFIYPAYAHSILSKKQMQAIVSFAKGYPRNMGRTDKLPRTMGKLVARGGNPLRKLREFVTLGPYIASDSASDLDTKYGNQGHIQTVIGALAADPRRIARRNFKPLRYYSDLGGFYPSPPPKWPRKLMYAIMDGFLENLPHIINMDDPGKLANLSPVAKLYFEEPRKLTGKIIVKKIDGGDTPETSEKLEEILKEIDAAVTAAVSAEMLALLTKLKPKYLKTIPLDVTDYSSTLGAIKTNIDSAILKRVDDDKSNVVKREELTFGASGPKSILEIVYDIAEIATAKYDYNMRGDDFKFAMAVVNYSFEGLSEQTQGSAFTLTQERIGKGIESIMGANKFRRLTELEEKLTQASMDENPRAAFKQSIVLAKLMLIHEKMEVDINTARSQDSRNIAREELRQNYRKLIEKLPMDSFSPSLNAGVQRVLLKMRQTLELRD